MKRASLAKRRSLLTLFIAAVSLICCFSQSGEAQHFYDSRYGRRTNVKFDSFDSRMLDRKIKYSIYLPPGYYEYPAQTYPILYYIHGFDLKGKALMDWVNWNMDVTIDKMIEKRAVEEMIVVIPGCDVTGLVVDWGEKPKASRSRTVITFPYRAARGFVKSFEDVTYLGSYLYIHRWDLTPSDYVGFLTEEFISQVEGKYRVKGGRSNRAITGFSTGGYSALSVAFQHPELFDSVSAHSPMLTLASPFSARAEEFFVQFDPGRARLITHNFFINLLRRIFQNEENWDRQDPLQLARFQPLDELPVYLDVADKDKRGYDLGAKKLVGILLDRNVPVEFVLVRGLAPGSSHTYPGFLNGRLVSELAKGKTSKEADRYFHWENVKDLINPDVQQVEYSLEFHSRQFQR